MLTPEQKQLKKDYMDTFSLGCGQRVLKDLGSRGFKNMSTIPVPGISPPGETLESNEGKRQMLLHIETMMSPGGMETQGASNTGTGGI